MTVKIYKLSSGEEIIAEEAASSQNFCELRNPMIIVEAFLSDGTQTTFLKRWLQPTSGGVFVAREHLLTKPAEVMPEIATHYRAAVQLAELYHDKNYMSGLKTATQDLNDALSDIETQVPAVPVEPSKEPESDLAKNLRETNKDFANRMLLSALAHLTTTKN